MATVDVARHVEPPAAGAGAQPAPGGRALALEDQGPHAQVVGPQLGDVKVGAPRLVGLAGGAAHELAGALVSAGVAALGDPKPASVGRSRGLAGAGAVVGARPAGALQAAVGPPPAVEVEVDRVGADVVEDAVQHEVDARRLRRRHQRVEVVHVTELVVDAQVVDGVVAVVGAGLKDRVEVERGHPEALQVAHLAGDAREVAAGVAGRPLLVRAGARPRERRAPRQPALGLAIGEAAALDRVVAGVGVGEAVGEDLVGHALGEPGRRLEGRIVDRELEGPAVVPAVGHRAQAPAGGVGVVIDVVVDVGAVLHLPEVVEDGGRARHRQAERPPLHRAQGGVAVALVSAGEQPALLRGGGVPHPQAHPVGVVGAGAEAKRHGGRARGHGPEGAALVEVEGVVLQAIPGDVAVAAGAVALQRLGRRDRAQAEQRGQHPHEHPASLWHGRPPTGSVAQA